MVHMTGKRLAFVEHVAQGKSVTEAARAAGYSERHARGRAYQLMRDPGIKAAVAVIQERVKQKAQYGVEQAVAEVDGLLAQARELKQMTAAAKLFDTKAKLYGLLVERHQIQLPSAAKAMDDANERIGLPRKYGTDRDETSPPLSICGPLRPADVIETTAIDVPAQRSKP